MNVLTRSRTAMLFLIAALVFYGISQLLAVVSGTILAGTPSSFQLVDDLGKASAWLGAIAFLVLVVGLFYVRSTSLEAPPGQMAEMWIVGLGAMLAGIGSLILATSNQFQTSSDVLPALGFGSWAFLALTRALRRPGANLDEPTASPGAVLLWFMASVGLTLTAIGAGLVADLLNRTVQITATTLDALGITLVALAVLIARANGLLGIPAGWVAGGVGALAISNIGGAVFTAVVVPTTLAPTGIAFASIATIALAGTLLIGRAAWQQANDITQELPVDFDMEFCQ